MRAPQSDAKRRIIFHSGAAISALAVSLAIASAATARDTTADNESAKDDIVVTGTLIRGVAPAGTNVVGVSEKDIQSSGATTVTELLTKVPQFGDFNSLQGTTSTGNTVTTNRPNLRNLPGQTTTGTSATLLLIDGHRVVGMGVASTTPDADFLPPDIIQRVEIVPDGGSALYGSDAVAGVVNFITMKRFDGVKVNGRYGFGRNFHTFDANATVGKDWGSGSLWVSYNYTENSEILGKHRDYNFTPEQFAPGTTTLIRSLNCPKPNISIAGQLYASPLPSTPGTATICDNTDNSALYPDQKRHSVYAGLNQQLNDWLEANVQAFYYRKDVFLRAGDGFGSVNLAPGQSPFDPLPAVAKTINFTFGAGLPSTKKSRLESWGYAGTFTANVGGGWQIRARAGYSESQTRSVSQQPNFNLFGVLATSGAFNPFAPATSSAAGIAQLYDYADFGEAKQRQFNARVIADGSLFELPGGPVKMAVGAEYLDEGYNIRKGLTVLSSAANLRRFQLGRKVKSAFGEIIAPIFGGDGGPSLTVSASGRFDDYNDVGGSFNPKFGATFKPVEWISIRGAWGKSFVAPSLADSATADPTDARYIGGATVGFLAPAPVLAANGYPRVQAGQNILILLGANPGLVPQKATTWSVGADLEPDFVPGLRLSGTYYNITYTNIISVVPFTNQPVYYSTYAPQSFTLNPTLAQIQKVIADDPDGAQGTPCAPLPSCVYGIQDVRKQNLSGFKQSGVDMSASYATTTGFGGLDFYVGGTYVLTRKGAPTAGAAYKSELGTFNSRLNVRSTLGADVGNLRAQATWNYSQGFDVPPAGLVKQTHVGDFNTVDLFFKYEFPQEGVFNDLELNLTVTNVFDQSPPVYYGGDIVLARAGFLNGNTFGRLVQVGFRKQF